MTRLKKELEKALIVINVIKSIVEALKPPTIINSKRKITDMLMSKTKVHRLLGPAKPVPHDERQVLL